MHDNRTHPLLQQVPLTVSPFVNLPTATTLPYRYKPMPSTLPPSAAGISATAGPPTEDPNNAAAGNNADESMSATAAASNKPRYVVSASGHAAHPDEILASCRALLAHVTQLCTKAEQDLAEFDERVRARELAEKRRVAPGWLDSEARLLEPEKGPASSATAAATGGETGSFGGGPVSSEIEGGFSGKAPADVLLLQQPVEGLGGRYGNGSENGYRNGHGPGGASEMAVPDEGEQLDRAFGTLELRGS
ncbi:hypothetical protein P885DRAFT_68846 [Corynascus similis CBS 632.67]